MITENYFSLQLCSDKSAPAHVFGVDLHHLVEKEGCATPVPLLIQKSVAEIEQRGLKVCFSFSGSCSPLSASHPLKGPFYFWLAVTYLPVCQVVGLYRLCGSAAVKKELRDWFERNSAAVCLSEDLYPDINVITGHSDLRSNSGTCTWGFDSNWSHNDPMWLIWSHRLSS